MLLLFFSNRCVLVLFFCCLSFLCSLLVLFPFLKFLYFFFIIISFFFFQQFLSIVMPNSVNARCFPCKNTLRPSVVHNLTKISSFDQKMWAKETNRFFFFNQSFIFFHFHQCFFLRGQGGFFLFFFDFYIIFCCFFYVQFEERRWMNITAFYVFQYVFFFNALLTKKKLTPNALRTGRAGLRAGILSTGPCHVTSGRSAGQKQ